MATDIIARAIGQSAKDKTDKITADLNEHETQIGGLQSALNGKANATHQHSKTDISDFPTLATVATSGNYSDLSGKPSIPTVNDTLTSTSATEALSANQGKILRDDLDTHKADGTQHAKTARFVIGTSAAGWTAKDCDYLCDGENDQEEIMQALEALPGTGGEVVILDGTYNITASIHIPKNNVSIRGNGNATILKRKYNSTSEDSGSTVRGLITLIGRSGCKIQDLQIDGDKSTYDSSYNYGIWLTSSSNNTVTGNTCSNNSNSGIYLSSSSNNNTVTGNTCNNNSNSGIYLSSSSNNNTVTDNTCNNNSNGIYLSSSSNNTVTGNTCNNNSNNGIWLTSSSNNNTITGNTCNNNSNNGIYLSSSSNNNTVTGDTCNNNKYGINLSSSSNNTVTGNNCNNNNYGIRLSSSSNNTITGNTCIRGDYASNQYTIQLQGTDNNYNLLSLNNCMGKKVVVDGGTGNSVWGNKFDNTNDLPDDLP